MDLRIFPPEEIIDGTVAVPYSKSFVNRLIAIDIMAATPLPAPDASLCGDDIRVMLAAARTLGKERVIDLGSAATAMRFLTAAVAVSEGIEVTLTGSEQLCSRPISPLVAALQSLGADIEYQSREGYPPLTIRGHKLKGGKVALDASISSQFVSALMMAAPMMEMGLKISLDGAQRSRSYLRLTADIMSRRGATVKVERDLVTVEPSAYNSATLPLERDWSAVAFWTELAAISAGFIAVDPIERYSFQPDRKCMELYALLGVGECESFDFDDEDDDDDSSSNEVHDETVLHISGSPEVTPRLNYDFADNPDLAQGAAVTCVLIGIPFNFSGLSTLLHKETNRISALVAELAKLGASLTTDGTDTLAWDGSRMPIKSVPIFATYGDHRMAMALAPVSVFIPGIIIEDAGTVEKSYPGYWEQLKALGFTLEEVTEREEVDGQ